MPKNMIVDKLYPIIQEIAIHLPARLILEVGVSRGHSTIPLAKAAQANNGHVWSLDIIKCTRAIKNMRIQGLMDWWTFEQTCSWEWTGGPSEPFDLAFIDGDHGNVSKDWWAFEPRVKQGGFILLHDYFGGCRYSCGICPVCLETRKLVDTVIRPQWERWECVTLPFGYGLTIVRKR
jgi:predicted O-methyltransferase YrrM